MSSGIRNTFMTVATTFIVCTNAFNALTDTPNASTYGVRSGLVEAYQKAEAEGREYQPLFFTAPQDLILTPDVHGTAVIHPDSDQHCLVFNVRAYNDTDLRNIASGTRTQDFKMTVCDLSS